MIPLREVAGGVAFAIRVQPKGRKNAITGVAGDALKLSVTAPPEAGRANQAIIILLAESLNLPRSSFTIAAGATSRNKRVQITGLSAEELRSRISAVLGTRH